MKQVLRSVASFLFILLVLPVYSQSEESASADVPYWILAMDSDDANYYRAVKNFDEYWKEKRIPAEDLEELFEAAQAEKEGRSEVQTTHSLDGEEMDFQYRRFIRWEWLHRSFVRPDGSMTIPHDHPQKDHEETENRNLTISADWIPTGPNSSIMNPLPQESRIGRMCQMKFHPHLPDKIYGISGSGGLFISEDNGENWSVTGTDALPFGYQPASICIDYTDDQILYLGMGDPNYASQGHGVWKSIDGGNSWFDASDDMGNRIVYEVLMSPGDHRVILAATDNGIWKSDDAGMTWDKRQAVQSDAFVDMKYKPGSNDTVYACTYSKFFRSNDGGENWIAITNGLQIPSNGGRGMRLAVSEAAPDIVYLGMLAKEGTVFKSFNSGTSFQTMYQDTVTQSLISYSGLVGGDSNGNYNFSMVADPLDANTVYFGTQTLWKSSDGGLSWQSLYSYLAKVHPDIHDLRFSPFDHSLFNLNDGGIARSTDGGNIWYQKNDGLVTAEIYQGAQSPIRKDMLIIGTQDNGALYFSKGKWTAHIGGDVYDQFWFDYHTPDKYYSDRGKCEALISHRMYNLNLPFTALGNRKFIFTPLDSNVAFICQNEVWRTTNLRSTTPVWTAITTALSSSSSDFVRDMVLSPINANELYVVLGNDKILHTYNALEDVPVFDTLIPPASTLYGQTSLALSKKDPDILYLSSWNQVFRSLDQGEHWTSLTDNLPNANISKIVHDDFSDDESIYVLCNNRIYYRNDSLNQWVDFSQGLPSLAYVSNLLIYNEGTRNSVLRAITYGRGVFETPMYRPDPLPYVEFSADTQIVCTHQPVVFSNESADGTSWHWTFDGGQPSAFDGQIPPPVVYDESGRYPVMLTVTNAKGTTTATKHNYIEVKSQFPVPMAEGFEGNFPPYGFEIVSVWPSNVKWYLGYLGGFSASTQSAVFADSYVASKSDMRFNVDLSNTASARLSFDLAYARRIGNSQFDSLEILVSMDCGVTFTSVYRQGGATMATMPDVADIISFNPGPNDWRTDTVDLRPFCGQENVFIYFRAWGSTGEIMLVDNIQIHESALRTLDSPNSDFNFTIIPNPSNGSFTVQGYTGPGGQLCITNTLGEVVYLQSFSGGNVLHEIQLGNQTPGVYFLIMTSGLISRAKIVMVQ